MNAWLKRCVFNLDLNRKSVSEPRTLSGRLFQSLGAKYEKVLLPLVTDIENRCILSSDAFIFLDLHLRKSFFQKSHPLHICYTMNKE